MEATRTAWQPVFFSAAQSGLSVCEFYLGDIGRGIAMLLFCWTGISSIIGFIREIIYLTESNEAFSRVLNNK
jgi:TM2 domain-containing membrane protein YozV